MRRAVLRVLTAALVTGSAALALAPLAHAAQTALVPTTEGWYQPNPTCAQPSGCLTTGTVPVAPPAQVPTSPYPARTMHVGYAGSAETARAYLAFPLQGLSGTVTGAQLDVPLDTAPADGDQQSDTAKIQACLATGQVVDADGSVAAPPTVSCDAHASVTYVAKPAPHLHADLAPLLVGLPTTSGIVLLPDGTKNGPTDDWRVVFSAHDRPDAAKTAPATLTLQVSAEHVASTPEQPTVALPAGSGAGFVPAPSTGLAPVPAVQPPAVTGPAVPQVALPQQQALPTAHTVTVGYAYPVVWLLPLALLVLVPLATKALTQDLAPS